jgi:hypothetical protein
MKVILRLYTWFARLWRRNAADTSAQQVPEWDPNTSLYQGAILPRTVTSRLGLTLPGHEGDTLAAIVSHDCDLVTKPAEEPFVELMLGCPIESLQSGCTHAQSTFKLHIEYLREGLAYPLEFVAINKASIRKTELAGVEPDPQLSLPEAGRDTFQAWLAARYRRAAFPDSLIGRLKPVRDKISRLGKKNPRAIIGIWMSFEPQGELSDDIPYELWISVVYSTRVSGADIVASEAAESLRREFEGRFLVHGAWQGIDLRRCTALSDTEFTLRDLQQTHQWRLEYISLRQTPPEPSI